MTAAVGAIVGGGIAGAVSYGVARFQRQAEAEQRDLDRQYDLAVRRWERQQDGIRDAYLAIEHYVSSWAV